MKLRHLPYFIAPLFATGLASLATSNAVTVTWDVANANNNWNTTDANWTSGATFANTNDAVFNGATGETVTVDSGGVAPASTAFSGNGSWTLTGGSITGTLTKSGTGALTLSNTGGNSFSGITLTGADSGTGAYNSTNGSLKFANGIALGTGSIDFSAVTTAITGFWATATTTVANNIVLPTSQAFGVLAATGNTTTYSGIISIGTDKDFFRVEGVEN